MSFHKLYKRTVGETKCTNLVAVAEPTRSITHLKGSDHSTDVSSGSCITLPSKGDIVELKSLAKPPDAVVKTMCGVLILFDQEPSWKAAKAMLCNMRFLSTLQSFDI